MQGPEHVVSLYIATCGQNGPGLGSDEKEIILLVYVLLEVSTGQVSTVKQSEWGRVKLKRRLLSDAILCAAAVV